MIPPKIVVAPDSFKGSLSAEKAAEAMATGILQACPSATVLKIPLADGGEGTLEVLRSRFAPQATRVAGAQEGLVPANWGWDSTTDTALIEVAQAVGLNLTPEKDRDPWLGSSVGVGELIMATLDAGARTIYLALGGTGTNDAGAGMLSALGARFLDRDGKSLLPNPSGLRSVAAVDSSGLDPRLASVRVHLLLDVRNPLTGPHGATCVYGPQKGVVDTAALDRVLKTVAAAAERDSQATSLIPGSGAAGGLGWAAMHFLNAQAHPGASTIVRMVGLRESLQGADLLLTGEGRVDSQTAEGKTVTAALELARQTGIPAAVFAGSVAASTAQLQDLGAAWTIDLTSGVAPTEDELRSAFPRLQQAVRGFCEVWKLRQQE